MNYSFCSYEYYKIKVLSSLFKMFYKDVVLLKRSIGFCFKNKNILDNHVDNGDFIIFYCI
jgi:hypothetical protein